ncbi:MAG: PAS domain-containing sensor histidine kinase [Magnetospirillum gryphiswaldense]|nr:PAS domain-containing sensor histidine kinase [Magnetospirillum gryphiswaldense]
MLVTMALLLAAAAVAVYISVSVLNEEAEALEKVGAQRMMAQRAVVLAGQMVQPNMSAQQRQRVQAEMEALVSRMRGDAQWLIDHDDVPREIASLYATAWMDEAGVMARFHQNLRQILDGRGDVQALNHREAMLFNEEAAKRYKRHATEEFQHLRLVSVLSFLTLMGALVGLFLSVLRPGIKILQQQIMQQTALGDAIAQSGHGVLLVDSHGKIRFANAAAEALTGYDSDQLLNQELNGLIFSGYGGAGGNGADVILDRAFKSSWRGDIRLIRKGGIMGWAEMVVSASPIEGKYLVMLFDASERREAQIKLRQARERLFSAIEAVDDGFALFDAEERLLTCNRRFIALFPPLEPWLVAGTTYPEIILRMAKLGLVETELDEDRFLATRLALFRAAQGENEMRLTDGRILRCTDRRTPEGGRVSLMTDVTDSIQTRDHLRLALDQAQASLRSKAAFLSAMSHELRTPLNAIVGFSQLLEAIPDGQFGAKQRRSVSHILNAGRRLTDMVDQVLELAELQDGDVNLTIAAFDVTEVVQECAEASASLIADTEQTLVVTGCEAPVLALGDAARVGEVLRHLLVNAAKYGQVGGRVEVAVRSADNATVRLTVSDQGPGLPPELQEQLFRPFGRVGGDSGLGIGLAISRILVERMSGRIGVTSFPGQGCTFWVELPAHRDSGAGGPQAMEPFGQPARQME